MSYLIHTNNYEDNKKQLQDKVRELVKLDPTLITEYVKLYARVKKYGDPDVILKTGRKPVSPEHKKETYRKYYEKVKQKIVSLCKHEWVSDTIDIDLDRSKTIEYCKICELSK